GVEYMDRDEIADLSRSTPNNARFLRLILYALFYQGSQTREHSSKRDKERMIYAKDVFFTLRHDSEDEARKAWTESIAYFDDNIVRRRNSSTTWKKKEPKIQLIHQRRIRAIIDDSDDDSIS
ncbi:hypothetical protein PENTCL1PPCAC_8990, partial [Pristionchus entomophagus]